jgi:hypothetical protein
MIETEDDDKISMRTNPPPPIPATARAKMSVFIEGANPQNIVPDPLE